jgi:TetR/AcrR family transcriptional regulator, repressor for uid operon
MTSPSALSTDHRTRILEAAHRCFVRSGFHRATMQDVAAEAGMSAGNIYRYFDSKDAIVVGLCARDRAELADSFAKLQRASDPFAVFRAIGQRHLVDEPRAKAVFALDLWAEAVRNPLLGSSCREFETDIRSWMTGFIRQLVASGQADSRLDVDGLAELLLCMADGLLVRRAREPDFDASVHIAHVMDVLKLAAAGHMPSLLTASDEAGLPFEHPNNPAAQPAA